MYMILNIFSEIIGNDKLNEKTTENSREDEVKLKRFYMR